MHDESRKIYEKKGRRYYPIGYGVDYLTDGLWLVRSRPGCRSMTNVGYLRNLCGVMKVGENTPMEDFTKFYQIEELTDVVCDALMKADDKNEEMLSKPDEHGVAYGLCRQDYARIVAQAVFDAVEKKRLKVKAEEDCRPPKHTVEMIDDDGSHNAF